MWHAFKTLQRVVDEYKGPSKQCMHAGHGNSCDAMTLGKLMRELKRTGLDPLPRSPFHGLTFASLMEKLGEMRLTSLCEELRLPNPANVCASTGGIVIARISYSIHKATELELSGLILPAPTS